MRVNERLKDKDERFTSLGYTGWNGGLEHLKIETRLRGESRERFVSPMFRLTHRTEGRCHEKLKAKV
jgi:hypothetical protein